MAFFRGWRYAAFVSGFVGFIGLALYPIAIAPMIDPSEYSKYTIIHQNKWLFLMITLM